MGIWIGPGHLKTVYYCQLKKGLVKHKNFQYVKKITVLCQKIKRIREEKEYIKKNIWVFFGNYCSP